MTSESPPRNRSNDDTDSNRLGVVTECERRSLYDQRSYRRLSSILRFDGCQEIFCAPNYRSEALLPGGAHRCVFFNTKGMDQPVNFTTDISGQGGADLCRRGIWGRKRSGYYDVLNWFYDVFIIISLCRRRRLKSSIAAAAGSGMWIANTVMQKISARL